MTIRAEAERIIELPRERAFQLFVDYPNWHRWMPKTFQPLAGPSRPLEPGDRLQIRIPPLTVRVKVVRVRPGEEVAWAGGGPGLRATHSFHFEDAGDGRTRVRSVEPWVGLALRIGPLARRIQRDSERIGNAQLDGFAAYARAQA